MMSRHADGEKRRKVRVDYKTRILLNVDDKPLRLEGSSKDLSLNGLFVNTGEQIPLGTKCTVYVELSGKTDANVLEVNGSVVRLEPQGVAVAFDSMPLDSYTHLKNIVRYNSEDPDSVY